MIGDVVTLFFQDDVEHYRIDKVNEQSLELTGEHGKTALPHNNGLLESWNGRKITGFTLTPAPSPFIAGGQVRIALNDQTVDAQVVSYENHILEVVHNDEHYYLDMDNLPTEVESVASLESQDVEEGDDEGTPLERPLLAFQLNDLRKALTPHDATFREKAAVELMVSRFKELHEAFTDSAFEPTAPPGIMEQLERCPPPWIVPVIEPYKPLHCDVVPGCDEAYLDPTKTKGRYAAYNQCLNENFQTFESKGEPLTNRLDAAARVNGKLISQPVLDEPVNFKEFHQLPCVYSATNLYQQVTNEAAAVGFYECKRQWLTHSVPLDVNVDELLETCTGLSFIEVVEEMAHYGVRWWHITPVQRRRIDEGVRKRVQRVKVVSKEAAPSTSLAKADSLYLLPPMFASERLATRLEIDGLRAHLGRDERLKRKLALRTVRPEELIRIDPADEKVAEVVNAYYGADESGMLSILLRYGRDHKEKEDVGWAYFHDSDAKLAPLCLFEANVAFVEDGTVGFEKEKRRIPVLDIDGYRVNKSGAVIAPLDFKDCEIYEERSESTWGWLWEDVAIPAKERWRARDIVSATALAIVFGAPRSKIVEAAMRRKTPKRFEELVSDMAREIHFLQPPATPEVKEYTGNCSLENIKSIEAKRLDCAAQAVPMIRAALGKQTTNVRKLLLSSSNLIARLKAVNALTVPKPLIARQLCRKTEQPKKSTLVMEVEDEPTQCIELNQVFKEWGVTTGDQIDGGKLANHVKRVTDVVAACLKMKASADLIGGMVGEWVGIVRLSDVVASHVSMAVGILPHMAMLGFQHMFPGHLVPSTAPREKYEALSAIVKNYYQDFKVESSENVKDVYGRRARNEPFGEFGDSMPEKFAAYYDDNKQAWREIKEAAQITGEWRLAILKYCLLYAWCLLCEEGEYGAKLMELASARFLVDARQLNNRR